MSLHIISKEYLRDCFIYTNGKLTWKKRPENHFGSIAVSKIWNTKYSGKESGCNSFDPVDGSYRWVIGIDRKKYYRSRLVWIFHHGHTLLNIDHIDGNEEDDSIENLREATVSQNGANRKIDKDNKCGFKGVRFNEKLNKYASQIKVKNKQIHLGYFVTPEEAHNAYIKSAKNHFGEFACDGCRAFKKTGTIS